MRIENIMPFESLRELCYGQNAPVFPRRRKGTGRVFFVRRQGYTVQDVENFFARLTEGERTVNEPWTYNERYLL